jgi:hypothetical protein
MILAVVVFACAAVAAQANVFMPRNGGVEGRLGKAHVLVDSSAGGVVTVVSGQWPDLREVGRAEMVFELAERDGGPVEVAQRFDRSPEVIMLEEGSQRMGLRVKYKLYDARSRYYGHGLVETWLYPNGEIFMTAASSFENMKLAAPDGAKLTNVWKASGVMQVPVPSNGSLPQSVTKASLRVSYAPPVKTMSLGEALTGNAARAAAPASVAFNDTALPGRFVQLNPQDPQSLALYWRTGKHEFNNVVYRTEGGAPTYYRWPTYLIQAFGGATPQRVRVEKDALFLDWLTDKPAEAPNPSFVALYRLASGVGVADVESFVAAERNPVEITVKDGLVHGSLGGYDDQEGAYEVRKKGPRMTIVLPADKGSRTVRVKAIGIDGYGAVTARLNDKPVVPQLVAEGGIADDPMAPIRETPEGPADLAVVTVPLKAQPQELSIAEEEGVQFAYQQRDPWREITCYGSRGDRRHSLFRFSLVDGRLRNMRAYGQRDWALTENLLTWFPFCGFTPDQMTDQPVAFDITKNGPDAAEFRYVSRNASEGAQSDYTVGVRADSPAMQINVKAAFNVLESWPYPAAQFFDIFPFRGVWPHDWWYDEVLWVAPDGRTKWLRTKERKFGGDEKLETLTGGGFFALYSSDRGNMLMLTKSFKPALPVQYVICGNYIDFHMAVEFTGPDGKPVPPKKGATVSMEYDLALWGDQKVTRDQLIEIGKKSIAAGKLVLPK